MLKDLEFSDIYLGCVASWLAGTPGTLDPVRAPEVCEPELHDLREQCEQFVADNPTKQEFGIRSNGVSFRVSTLKSMAEVVYVLRRFPSEIPKIETLNIHQGHIDLFLQPKLTGLIVIAGAFGQGKTTTASSLIAARLSKFGGVGVSIEDPPEMPLEGRHGEGVCYQTWVEQGGFGHACRQAARWAPSIIFLGEVRDPETASEALRASINGRLVVCTTHADSVIMAIERMYSLANGVAGTPDDVTSLLSGGLAGVFHQSLYGDPKRPRIEALWLKGDEAVGARNLIRSRRFDQLGSEITLQLNRMLMPRAGKVAAA